MSEDYRFNVAPPESVIRINDRDGQTLLSIAPDGSVTASENFRAQEAAEQFLDALTDVVLERDVLRGAVREIQNAWNIEGSHPTYHRGQQMRLLREWPTMYAAIQRARHCE